MTSFLETIGASSYTWTENNMFCKQYMDLSNEHWPLAGTLKGLSNV